MIINSMKSSWKLVTSSVSQGSILGAIFFNIFIKELDDEAERSLSKFADNMKLGGVADMLEVRLTARGSLTGWRHRLKGTSSCSTRGTARFCFRGGTSTTVCWGLTDWKAAIQKRTWGGWLCAEPWLAGVLWVPHGSCAVAVGTTEDCQPVPLPSLPPLCTLS